jgi:N-acetylglucosaminyldiphosphoundecaprenol N-acetyl-beta-D-mannosaminyltransferase
MGGEAKTLPRVAIHAGSGGYSVARRWDADKFAAVADALHDEYGAELVLVGGKGDDTAALKAAMRAPARDLSGQTTLNELAGVLATCNLFIGADSGVMHIAAAVGVPVVAIFGPSNADAWHPWTPGGRHIVVSSRPECAPCSYVGFSVGLRNGSEARTCMRMVTPAHVLSAARALLPPPPTPSPFNSEREKHSISAASSAPSPSSESARGARLHILGTPVDALTYDDWLRRIGAWVRERRADNTIRAQHVCTTNPEFIMIAQGDPNFFNILNRAALCVPDGVGLLWAARRLGKPLPARVTGSDGVPIIAERAAREGWRLFLLGAAPGVAEKAAAVLTARNPGLEVVGTHSGSPAWIEEDAIVERVNRSGADILFVAYGAPEQDKWIARNLPRLEVAMAMGVGGALDFVAGVVPRAPLWMQRLGLEWLFRLYLQPWRIGRMMRLPRFVLAVLLNR